MEINTRYNNKKIFKNKIKENISMDYKYSKNGSISNNIFR